MEEKQSAKKGKKQIFFWVLLLFAIGLFLFALSQLIPILLEDREAATIHENFQEYVKIEAPSTSMPDVTVPAGDSAPKLQIDFVGLQEQNPDIIGWLYCPDTVINYPILQGEDNSYYLSHSPDKKSLRHGSLFIDYQNDPFSDDNTLLYGHRMNDGSMFGSLPSYENAEYYESHPVFYLYTPQKNYRVNLFSGYKAETDDTCYTLNFSESEFASFLSKAQSRSFFSAPITPSPADKIITFSTCVQGDDTLRFVLLGVLEELE